VNEGPSFARLMCSSFIYDESRRLTCQVIRLDWSLVVGYAQMPAVPVRVGPWALSNPAATFWGRCANVHLWPWFTRLLPADRPAPAGSPVLEFRPSSRWRTCAAPQAASARPAPAALRPQVARSHRRCGRCPPCGCVA